LTANGSAGKNARMVALRHYLGSLATACLFLACEGGQDCTLAGCGGTHGTTLDVKSDEPVSELTIEACFNDDCGNAQASPGGSAGLELAKGKLGVSASYSTAGSDWLLSIYWNVAESLPVKTGDRYAVRVKTPEGTTIAESVEIAESYSRSYPNGKDCSPECLHVSTRPAP
jgi:hypothetical protein